MRTTLALATTALLLGALGGCSSEKKICRQAARKYGACVGKILGPSAAKLARSKEKAGIAACSRDDATQRMYHKCLPEKSCGAFMKCMEDFARTHGPG